MKVVSHLVKFVRYLPRLLFDLMLTFSASAYVVVIFLIKEKITLPFIQQKFDSISYFIYLTIPALIAWGCLILSKYLPVCGVECQIKEVELASHSFLPNYLGYFFVGLSIPNIAVLAYVYFVIFTFTHFSKALSFNPMFLLLGYQFYFVTGEDGTKIFLITRQRMKVYQDVKLDNLRRINDFTFIDMR